MSEKLSHLPAVGDTIVLKMFNHHTGKETHTEFLISGTVEDSDCFLYVNNTEQTLMIRWKDRNGEFIYNSLLFTV